MFHKSDSGTSDSDSQLEKGQRESSDNTPKEKEGSTEYSTDSSRKPASALDDQQSDDSEPEPEGDTLFTDDQQRAMMELMAQKHDSGDYSGTVKPEHTAGHACFHCLQPTLPTLCVLLIDAQDYGVVAAAVCERESMHFF